MTTRKQILDLDANAGLVGTESVPIQLAAGRSERTTTQDIANLSPSYVPPTITPTSPTLSGSWTDYGSGWQGIQYYKTSEGVVHIEGRGLRNGGSQTIFTLPSGYRPAATMKFRGDDNVNIEVRSNGVVYADDLASSASLSGINFLAI